MAQIEAIQLHGGVGANIVNPPEVAGLLPQNWHGGKVGHVQEILNRRKVVLRANGDHLNDVLAVSSELLDV